MRANVEFRSLGFGALVPHMPEGVYFDGLGLGIPDRPFA